MNEREPTREDAPSEPSDPPPPEPADPPPAKPDYHTADAEPESLPGDPPPATKDHFVFKIDLIKTTQDKKIADSFAHQSDDQDEK